ncbi:MAG: TonB-dependent receptor [Proteobacteria bacterium]|nr:TonB-dependent receptor [Pseudomonadota bacterium]
MKRLNLTGSIRAALTMSAAATSLLMQNTALAQDDDEDIAEQGMVVVTGSRIRRVDIEAPQPVTVITRADIEATGEVSISEVLRGSSMNQIGSFKERSGNSAQSQSAINLRGIGSDKTLVLLDGRRMAGSPTIGEGSVQNLNIIPMEAVERIEILRDGASAVYGSDAVGGVVNIILRDDFDGVQIRARSSRPSQAGGDEVAYSVLGGIGSGKGHILFSLEHTEKKIVFDRNREFTSLGLSIFGFPGSFLVSDPGGFGFLGTFADARCPTALDTNAEFPNSRIDAQEFVFPFGTFVQSRCRFNYAATSATEASIKRDSLFINANYHVNEDIDFFARGTYSKNTSFGVYAPSPIIGGNPFAPTMSAANPNNPTAPGAVAFNPAHLPAIPCAFQTDGITPCNDYSQFDANGDRIADAIGPFDLAIFYRNIPGGLRNGNTTDNFYDYLMGFSGQSNWLGGSEWTTGLQYSKQTSVAISEGQLFQASLQNAIDDGSFDVFGVNGPTSIESAQSFTHNGFTTSEFRFVGFDASLSWDLFQTRNGPVPIVVGGEYQDTKFLEDFDTQAKAGRVFGGVGQIEALSAARVVQSLFLETEIPILEKLAVNLAVRYDSYNDFGTTVNPKISVGWRPTDSLLIRSSWGQGFRAPTFRQLYDPEITAVDPAQDSTLCFNAGDTDANGIPDIDEDPFKWPGGHPCSFTLVPGITGGNQELQPELSENLNAGIVWSPSDSFTMSVDYYQIELEDSPQGIGAQFVLDRELRDNMGGLQGIDLGALAVVRAPNGSLISTTHKRINIGKTRTAGFDVMVNYKFSLGAVGDFSAGLQGSKMHYNDVDRGDGLGLIPRQFFFLPPWRATVSLDWSLGDFRGVLVGNGMAAAPLFFDNAPFESRIGSFVTWDLQFGWDMPGDGKLTIGARNIFDRDPPLEPIFSLYSNDLHDIYGRVPYIRFEKNL